MYIICICIAFASISSNRNRGSFYSEEPGIDVEEKILFRVESHVFAGEEVESKWRLYKFLWLKPIYFSEYSKHILELWNSLKPFTRTSVIPFACMNDPESEQIYTQTSYFCTCSSWSYGLNKTQTSKNPYNMVMSYKLWIKFRSVGSPKKNKCSNNLFARTFIICLLSGSFMHENGC